MRRLQVLVLGKYVAIFVFVIWTWESADVEKRPLMFWSVWCFSLVYGAYLAHRYRAAVRRRSQE